MSGQITPEEAPSEIDGDGRFFLPDKLVDRPEGEILRQAEKGDARHQYLIALEYWFNDIHSTTKWCRKAADQGYAPAQCFLGFLYGNEYLTFPGYDLRESAKWHRKAADQGYAPAQFFLGVMYDKGESVAQNHAEAARWYRKAAEQDLHEAQFNLGLKYDKGQGVPQDYTEAVRWFRKAAEQDLNNVLQELGLSEAQFTLGQKYESGQGVVQDYLHAHMWMTVAASMAGSDGRKIYTAARDRVAAKMNPTQIAEAQRLASSWYRKAADRGESFAQFHLGVMYSNGQGVPQNDAEAIRWYQKAADQGNADAQFRLGLAFDAGKGLLQSKAEAVKWFRKAADRHHAEAQLNLGAAYKYGQGVPQNHGEAISWFRKAAEQGNARAQTMLGHAYADGEVVRQDHDEAAKWFRKAAQQGFAYAQGHLGLAYQNGLGVPRDYVQAHLWTNLAARSYPASDDKNRNIEVSNLDLLSRKMTPSQIAEARRLAEEWKPLEEMPSKSERMDLPEESTGQVELSPRASAPPITTSASGLSQVVGMANLKEQLIHDVIGPSTNPELYRRYRVSLPNGILFYGPPGCGKTYVARSLAAELGWSFQYCRPSDVASPYIHETVSKIRSVFATAIEKAPSIVFIDEFEAFVPARSELGAHQQYKAEEVNEFLSNLEGCAERKVLVIAATNEPDKIDPAVRRSGRFDKLILIPPPDAEARKAMLEFHLNDRLTEASLDTAGIAAVLEGYSASDIKLLVEEAARTALKTQGLIATRTLLAVLDRVPASITADDMQRYELFRSRGAA